MEMIIKETCPIDEELDDPSFLEVYQEATDIYGLLHSRYIQTPRGLSMMREKILNTVYGVCPRLLCGGNHVIPIGMSERLKDSRVKLYCPKCGEIYVPKRKCEDIDGAYFGPSFPFILLKYHPDLGRKEPPKQYEPSIYGFKLHGERGSEKFSSSALNMNGGP